LRGIDPRATVEASMRRASTSAPRGPAWRSPRGFAAALVAVGLALVGAPARAEEEVRILLASGKKQVSLEGERLAFYDGDAGDRVAWGPLVEGGRAIADDGKVVIEARGLKLDAPRAEGRRLYVESESGVRVEGRLYLGRVTLELDPKKGTLVVINRLPMETYLLGLVGAEMNPDWPLEALKAQAVAARTYALQRRMMMRAADKPYDMEATVLSQVYLGADKIRPSVIEAVVATRGEVVAYKHRLVEALFHSTCGGTTVAANEVFGNAVPYLSPAKCPWCKESNRSKWTLVLPLEKLGKVLERHKLVRGKLKKLERSDVRGPLWATVGNKRQRLSPKEVRQALGYMVMLSERFTAEVDGKNVEFTGVGFGHGVGMCQWGAKGQADRGLSHREILEHYYVGAEVKRIY
jgi:stage II sporulation protein D